MTLSRTPPPIHRLQHWPWEPRPHRGRHLRSSVSPPSSAIWKHPPWPLLNHMLCCFAIVFSDFSPQNCRFYEDRDSLILFLAPWLLAHPRCTLKMYWCVNEWVCDAVHASHQPDVLYLHALHFARVPLKNITRLAGERRRSLQNNTLLSTLFQYP